MTASSGQQALANGRQVKSGYSGMCQKYVREPCWKVPSLYGSAIEAWNGAKHKHPGDRTPPAGAPCYYRGGNYGHAVISAGDGKVIRSTDCTYAGDISEVDISWVESHWGYVYLGWTGDLNGVDLPLGGDGGKDKEVELDDKIANWSPDDGDQGELTVGKTLNQARGYAEDAYQRIKDLEKKVDKILNKLS